MDWDEYMKAANLECPDCRGRSIRTVVTIPGELPGGLLDYELLQCLTCKTIWTTRMIDRVGKGVQ